jgi:acyl-CoA dehydrogenase
MMAIDHVNTRQQFGKPLSKLQAVQQSLAIAAIEAAAVNSAGQAAALALDRGPALFEVAAAKLRTNIAIGQAVGIVHQVHGAIGFTEEYPLHPLTNRLASWRSEFGGDRYWADILGAMAARWGGSGLWAELTRRSDGFGELSHV